jgi:hypothetical protein
MFRRRDYERPVVPTVDWDSPFLAWLSSQEDEDTSDKIHLDTSWLPSPESQEGKD